MLLFETVKYLASRLRHAELELHKPLDYSTDHDSRSVESKKPLVSIIIPTRDSVELLEACLNSIFANTHYPNIEILIVDNQSQTLAAHDLFARLKTIGVKVIRFDERFNYSKICNLATKVSNGSYLCLLNNDTVVLSPNWLDDMLAHAQNPKVGVVGASLFYPDGTVQHKGLVFAHKGIASHAFRGKNEVVIDHNCHEVSGVTFACALIKKSLFIKLGGLDTQFAIGLNDVDYCSRNASFGLKSVICSSAKLTHVESQTRRAISSPMGFATAAFEVLKFLTKHGFPLKDKYFRVSQK